MGSRIAFVVNALTGPELSAGKADSARIYALLMNGDLGKCNPKRSPSPLHECSTRTAFTEALHGVLKTMAHDDQLVLYFTGHGTYRHNIYCIVFGSEPEYVRFDNILGDISTYGISRSLIILDACHSGAAVEAGIKSAQKSYNPQSQDLPRGIGILTSCRGVEWSSELPDGSASVFTHLLCEAIETGLGGKPTDDGVITVTNAVDFIKQRLSQTPSANSHNSPCMAFTTRPVKFGSHATKAVIEFNK